MSQSPPRLQAVVFDWAGTTIDFGSLAPAGVFREIFQQEGVEITVAQAREPMGRAKREHIRAILDMPDVTFELPNKAGQSGRGLMSAQSACVV